MDQLVSQIFAPFVNIVTNLIKTHLGYATCSTKHVNNMRNKMKVLEDTSADVKQHMDTNKINGKEIPTGVPEWLDDVKDLKEKVKSISSDGIGCLNMKMRYRAGRNAFKATETIEELTTTNSGFTWTDAPIPTGRVMNPQPASSTTSTPPSSSSGGDVFKSRDVPFNDALKFLQQDDDKSQVIALCGMGGVGKTTMMNQLIDDKEVETRFHCIVKVAIGRDPNMHSIQNDIALCLGGEGLREETITRRADGLCRRFKNLLEDDRKKILVILDDVWGKVELQDIGLTSPLPKGVKLLLTSRDSKFCQQIAVDACSDLQEVKVDVLKKVEANNFFSRITQVSEEDDGEKYLIGCDIVKKCGYLPLAIKLIASTLKSKEDYVWRNTLNRLKNNDDIDKVQEVIRISYEHIEEYEEKEIFLHCGLFPEDYNIPIEYLTRHAWGLKLLGNISNLREARDRVRTYVSNLINANLLIRSDDVTCVKMHDLVLAFVLGKVSKGDHAWLINHGDVSKWGRDETRESCKRISLTCKGLSQFPRDFKYPNLSLIQLMHGDYSLKFPEDFYENMKKLEVISYINMHYPPLPRSLQCSTNLKSLCLYNCKSMFDCPFIGDLMNLEVLSFAFCGIRKLPSKIGNLRKLKLLDLTECIGLHIEDGVFTNLKNLEELYMIVNANYRKPIRLTDANLEELKMLSSKLHALEVEFLGMNTRLKNFSFTQLYKFKIAIGCLFNERGISFNSNLFKNTLKLMSVSKNDLQECKINELFKKTERLYLQVNDMIGLEDIVSIYPNDQHPFCYLRELKVSDCVELKYLCTMSLASGLRKLESLTVSSCSALEALVHNDGREINCVDEIVTFDNLKFLCLEKLPKLVSLFLIDNTVELPQLVALIVDGLPNFTSIYPDKNSISTLQQPFLNNQVRIPGLKILKVASMEKLKQIWACNSMEEEVNNISTLREIEVRGCDSLVNLFPTNPMRLLNHLERLTVRACNSIEVIFNIDMECFGHEVSKSRLRNISVHSSRNVREVWRIKDGENNSNSICGFEAVESIIISNCKRFRNVFTPTNTKFDMRALTHFDISPYNSKAEVGRNEGDDNISILAFPSNLYMDTFQYLRKLRMKGYHGVEVVFEMNSPSSGELITTNTNNQQPLPLLPNLQELELRHMQMMSHVWKWNKFLILQNQSSFHKLTTVKMSHCHKIKYLLSPLMMKLLSNLQKIYIEDCDGMEEVVSNRDEEITTTTTFFPCLHSLSFKHMGNLKSIGGGVHDKFKFFQVGVISWSLCRYSRQVKINSCDALSSVIPYYAIEEMQNLQVLKVYSCASLIEVFETQGINNNSGGASSSSTNIDEGNGGNDTITLAISRLENINVAQLSNLNELVIVSCDLLQHVFTFSTLESMKQLEVLTVKGCTAMKVIVKKENEEQKKVVVFPHLKSLQLINLPNLNGFFLGKNEFHWSLLETVMISQCPQMITFTYHYSMAPKLKYMHTSLGKHSLECGLNFHVTTSSHQTSTRLESLLWSFHNLIEIDMKDDQEVKNIIPYNELLHMQKLERILINHISYVKEVFEVEATEGTNSESQTYVVEIPNLTQVELSSLYNLKYIWKSNHHGRSTVLKFPSLTILSIHGCNKLKHVFTSSMVRSLQQLQDLHISSCSKMEVIVKVEESTFECDDKVSEIVTLPCLKSLTLQGLENLKGFCLGKDDFSCPSLHTLKITACPEITVFTKGHLATPALNIIDTGFGRCYLNENLNSFILTNQDALSCWNY